MTRKIILVLPNPDIIILSSVHKYHSFPDIPEYIAKDKPDSRIPYTEAYTLQTLTFNNIQKTDITKILIIGHGDPELPTTCMEADCIDKIATALVESKVIFSPNIRIVLDACFAFHPDETLSTIFKLKIAIGKEIEKMKDKKLAQKLSYRIKGYVGAVVPGGSGRRLVVNPIYVAKASVAQTELLKKYSLTIGEVFENWKDDCNSEQIFELANNANGKTKVFFNEFREILLKNNWIMGKHIAIRENVEESLIQV